MFVEDMTAEQCRQWADELQAQVHGHYGKLTPAQHEQASLDLEDVYEHWKGL